MKTRIAGMLVVSASAIAMMGAPAFAAGPTNVGNVTGNGNLSLASGNNVNVPISIPVDVCGNALAILGFAEAGCQGGATVYYDSFNPHNSFNSTSS